MKAISLRTVAFAAPLFSFVVVYGCAPDDATVSNPGVGGTGGAAPVSTAGSTSAGTPATGGGTPTTGGGTPSGGQTTVGGSGAGSAALAGAGGTPTAGTGGVAAGGAGGAPAGGCTDPTACIDVVASAPSSFNNPGWKDSWWVTGCDQKNANDCITNGTSCNATDGAMPEQHGARTTEAWTLGGVKGQHYKVTFKFNAVTEAKRYMGGHRDRATAEADPHNTPLDMFYRDGTSPLSNYNVVKLTIYDDAGVEKRHFYMNAAPDTGALTDWEAHYTFLASYTKSIVVIGGGKIEHLVQDSNCHAIDNCGADYVNGNVCPQPRKLPAPDDTLTLPTKYQDPKDGMVKNTSQLVAGYPNLVNLGQPWHAQAGHLKITAI
jgi:hypothetical protein